MYQDIYDWSIFRVCTTCYMSNGLGVAAALSRLLLRTWEKKAWLLSHVCNIGSYLILWRIWEKIMFHGHARLPKKNWPPPPELSAPAFIIVVIHSMLVLVTQGGWLGNHFFRGGWSFGNKGSSWRAGFTSNLFDHCWLIESTFVLGSDIIWIILI